MKCHTPLLALTLLAGCGRGAVTANQDQAPEPVASVKVARAELGSATDSVIVYGATEAGPGGERAVIAPAEAIVGAVLAPNGTAVGAGQAIATLRPSLATTALIARSATESQVAEAAYARALRLRGDGLVSNADVETARASASSARAVRATLGIVGGGLTLRAPASGTVQALTARVGDQLAAGATVATIAGRSDVRARFGVDPAIAPRIRPGQPIRIQLASGGAETSVPVVGVDPQVDPATHLASVYVRVPGGVSLSAGEPMRATLQVGATATGITIPYAALLDDGGRSYVFVVKQGIAKSVDVTPGNSAGGRIQILNGLQADDLVVTEGGTALEDGIKVVVQEGSGK